MYPPPVSSSPTPLAEHLAALAFAHLPDPLDYDNGLVRVAAAQALARCGPAAVAGLVQCALADPYLSVAQTAIQSLAAIGDPRAVPPLIEVLGNPRRGDALWGPRSWFIRHAAAEALGKLGARAAVPGLIAGLTEKAGGLRAACAEALGRIGDPAAREPLCALVRDGKRDDQVAALRALGALGDPAAEPVVLSALQSPTAAVKAAALDALSTWGTDLALPALRTLQPQARGSFAGTPLRDQAEAAIEAIEARQQIIRS